VVRLFPNKVFVYFVHKIEALDKDRVCRSVCRISEITGCNSVISAITSRRSVPNVVMRDLLYAGNEHMNRHAEN
jgi:ribosomal protein L5